MAMYPCTSCHRHLRSADRACPFCGTQQHTVGAPEPGGSSVWGAGVLVAAMLCTGCGKSPTDPGASEEDSSTSTSTSSTSTTTAGDTDTETSTGVDDGDDANDDSDPSGGFYAGPDEDFGDASECDPWMQDCPEGEKCVPYGSTGGIWDANKCVPVLGDGSAGDPCIYGGVVEATDDCDATAHCWGVTEVEGALVGTCAPFCGGLPDDPICPPNTACFNSYSGSTNLCLDTCDPLMQDCEEGLGCYWGAGAFMCMVNLGEYPNEQAPREAGEPCGFANDCALGLICLDAEAFPVCNGSACCAEYCALDDPEACPDPELECVGFFEQGMAIPGYENVGTCISPP